MKKLLLISLLLIACTKEEPVYDSPVIEEDPIIEVEETPIVKKYVSSMTQRVTYDYTDPSYDEKTTENVYYYIYDDEYRITRITDYSSTEYTFLYEEDVIYFHFSSDLMWIYYLDSGYLIKEELYFSDELLSISTFEYDLYDRIESFTYTYTSYSGQENPYSHKNTYTWINDNITRSGYSSYVYYDYEDKLNIELFYPYGTCSIIGILRFPGIYSKNLPSYSSSYYSRGDYTYELDEDGYPIMIYRLNDSYSDYTLHTYYYFTYIEVE